MRKPGFDQMIYYVRERDKSAELVVTHQPKVCDPSAEGLLGPVSRTCTHQPKAFGTCQPNLHTDLAPDQGFEP